MELRLSVPTDGVVLAPTLYAPSRPGAVVVVASGGSRGAANAVGAWPACRLAGCDVAVLAVDLLVRSECADPRRRLDVFLLARRLEATVASLDRLAGIAGLRIGYLAAGAAAAGALVASLGDPRVGAIVCRCGRPDLAQGILHRVTAPTLLLTDPAGLDLNVAARREFRCPTELRATDEVDPPVAAQSAPDPGVLGWLVRHLVPAPPEVRPAWPSGAGRLDPGRVVRRGAVGADAGPYAA